MRVTTWPFLFLAPPARVWGSESIFKQTQARLTEMGKCNACRDSLHWNAPMILTIVPNFDCWYQVITLLWFLFTDWYGTLGIISRIVYRSCWFCVSSKNSGHYMSAILYWYGKIRCTLEITVVLYLHWYCHWK